MKYFASIHATGNDLKIWAMGSKKLIKRLIHTGNVSDIDIIKNGKYILSAGSYSNQIFIWSFLSGRVL